MKPIQSLQITIVMFTAFFLAFAVALARQGFIFEALIPLIGVAVQYPLYLYWRPEVQ